MTIESDLIQNYIFPIMSERERRRPRLIEVNGNRIHIDMPSPFERAQIGESLRTNVFEFGYKNRAQRQQEHRDYAVDNPAGICIEYHPETAQLTMTHYPRQLPTRPTDLPDWINAPLLVHESRNPLLADTGSKFNNLWARAAHSWTTYYEAQINEYLHQLTRCKTPPLDLHLPPELGPKTPRHDAAVGLLSQRGLGYLPRHNCHRVPTRWLMDLIGWERARRIAKQTNNLPLNLEQINAVSHNLEDLEETRRREPWIAAFAVAVMIEECDRQTNLNEELAKMLRNPANILRQIGGQQPEILDVIRKLRASPHLVAHPEQVINYAEIVAAAGQEPSGRIALTAQSRSKYRPNQNTELAEAVQAVNAAADPAAADAVYQEYRDRTRRNQPPRPPAKTPSQQKTPPKTRVPNNQELDRILADLIDRIPDPVNGAVEIKESPDQIKVNVCGRNLIELSFMQGGGCSVNHSASPEIAAPNGLDPADPWLSLSTRGAVRQAVQQEILPRLQANWPRLPGKRRPKPNRIMASLERVAAERNQPITDRAVSLTMLEKLNERLDPAARRRAAALPLPDLKAYNLACALGDQAAEFVASNPLAILLLRHDPRIIAHNDPGHVIRETRTRLKAAGLSNQSWNRTNQLLKNRPDQTIAELAQKHYRTSIYELEKNWDEMTREQQTNFIAGFQSIQQRNEVESLFENIFIAEQSPTPAATANLLNILGRTEQKPGLPGQLEESTARLLTNYFKRLTPTAQADPKERPVRAGILLLQHRNGKEEWNPNGRSALYQAASDLADYVNYLVAMDRGLHSPDWKHLDNRVNRWHQDGNFQAAATRELERIEREQDNANWKSPAPQVVRGDAKLTAITDAAGLCRETIRQSHCVYSYAERCQQGESLIYRYRDNELKATLEIVQGDHGEYAVSQFRGRKNSKVPSEPERDAIVKQLLDELNAGKVPATR